MTDNEKRAHDISIALINRIIDMEQQTAMQEQLDSGATEINISSNPYDIYKRTYDMLLKEINKDFHS